MDGLAKKLSICVFMSPLFSVPASAEGLIETLRASTQPLIEGKLMESPWQVAQRLTGFKSWWPDFGRELVEEPEVWAGSTTKTFASHFNALYPPLSPDIGGPWLTQTMPVVFEGRRGYRVVELSPLLPTVASTLARKEPSTLGRERASPVSRLSVESVLS